MVEDNDQSPESVTPPTPKADRELAPSDPLEKYIDEILGKHIAEGGTLDELPEEKARRVGEAVREKIRQAVIGVLCPAVPVRIEPHRPDLAAEFRGVLSGYPSHVVDE